MKKKSYLESSSVDSKSSIKEFDVLFPKIAQKVRDLWKSNRYKKAIKLAKKDPKMAQNLKNLNKSSKDAEDAFEKQFGIKLDLSRHKLSDFF